MESFFPFHKFTPIESMILQIKDEGQQATWQYIEKTFNNPFQRIGARKLFAQAVKKLEEN